MAGLTEVAAIVKDVDDLEALEIALIENLQREDLNAVEIAVHLSEIHRRLRVYLDQDLAKKIGVDRSSITNYVRLPKLPGVDQEAHDRREAYPGARQGPPLPQVREGAEGLRGQGAERGGDGARPGEGREKRSTRRTPGSGTRRRGLRRCSRIRVTITMKKNKGKIIVEFFSEKDLRRIVEAIINIKQ